METLTCSCQKCRYCEGTGETLPLDVIRGASTLVETLPAGPCHQCTGTGLDDSECEARGTSDCKVTLKLWSAAHDGRKNPCRGDKFKSKFGHEHVIELVTQGCVYVRPSLSAHKPWVGIQEFWKWAEDAEYLGNVREVSR